MATPDSTASGDALMMTSTMPETSNAKMTNAAPTATPCFHCGLPVPANSHFAISWEQTARALCCAGCEAVATAILNAGLSDYYRLRTQTAPTPRDTLPDVLQQLTLYDHPKVQRGFVRHLGDRREATLILDGITCAACVWLNEQQLKRLPGIQDVQVNYATRRAHVVWDAAQLKLSDILRAVQSIGYRAYPYDPNRSQQLLADERRRLLRRLGVAGMLGAQTMTLAVALYTGSWSSGEKTMRLSFYWISLLLTLPIVFYAAQPFFRGAWNDLRRRRVGMDAPITLGISGAFAASVWTTITGSGTIYYDSVAMFIFFLLGARYFELTARTRATESAETLAREVPAIALRVEADGVAESVAVADLEQGDVVRVRPGEKIPADGVVLDGKSSVNESLLTGESLPLSKSPGNKVIGGSINVESPLTMRVERVGTDTVLSAVMRLLDRAQTEKPHLARLADRVATWFVAAVLVVAALVGVYWWQHDPVRALPTTIAVLIVTCPCALGLATPTALTAATGALARDGLLVTRGHALEILAHVTHFVFDKTGTLTWGQPVLTHVEPLGDIDIESCLAYAAALERHSEHPIAKAILAAASGTNRDATQVDNVPGEGIGGKIDEAAYYLGTAAFIKSRTGIDIDSAAPSNEHAAGTTTVWLADETTPLAAFRLRDTLRPGAADLIATLKQGGLQVALLSGDQPFIARQVAHQLGINRVQAALKPADKLAELRRLQAEGAVVGMVGDGVNDAPVLAAAQVSIAMGSGATLSTANADMILLAQSLGPLQNGWHTAKRTLRVIHQNLAWAITYNVVAIPAAAAGLVTPWMAALGMSLSSALVVANALRLTKTTGRKTNSRDTS